MFFRPAIATRMIGCSLALAACAVAAEEIRLVGTDLLGADVSRALLIAAHREDQPIALALDGSRPGLDELRSGRARLALLSLPDAEIQGLTAFVKVPVAWHRALVLVPADAPLEQITLQQLAGVFGRDGPDDLQRWGDLVGEDPWSRSPLRIYVPAPASGMTLELFRHRVLAGGAYRSSAATYARIEEVSRGLRGESRMMAVVGFTRPDFGGKTLHVATRAGEPAYAPSSANVESGDYPLRLPVYVVFAGSDFRRVAKVVRILLGDELAAHFERFGVGSRPPEARRQTLRELENLEPKNLQK